METLCKSHRKKIQKWLPPKYMDNEWNHYLFKRIAYSTLSILYEAIISGYKITSWFFNWEKSFKQSLLCSRWYSQNLAIKGKNIKISCTAKQIKHSRSEIYNVSKDNNVVAKKLLEWPRNSTQWQDREILRTISKQMKHISENCDKWNHTSFQAYHTLPHTGKHIT